MRTVYRQLLDTFAHDLIVYCDTVDQALAMASEALRDANLQKAEDVLTLSDQAEELRQRCEDRAVELLALENPLARDLRQVVTSIYIVQDFDRIFKLSCHIAKLARRRHPHRAVPADIQGFFDEMARLCAHMLAEVRDILVVPDEEKAITMDAEDDAVDDINAHLNSLVANRPWEHGTRAAVDVTLLSRYYERCADHCVNVATQVVYLVTGLRPDEYLEKREEEQAEAEIAEKFQELERRFRS
ncbi:phosphate signaling complex protein PhoU [Corynebacterium pyruviciproducens]|uniref:Phosphate signaling complex protein PhoU n=1 Tax=Corynebacterium pyruviciproducens TaxID=598660 RepID=A0AAF0YWI1_9CORY|nr:phosphate signaling complex protein PhoU [Corynebacterium pyruviciproducens]MDH4658400.1 phosphate signaling complex protein PhoU [Corynebacterium pyruviciproducens]MDK6564839.1 phosphate signaling complex protein PhoU [Corynebacterium pyruviciproducens]MDK7214814.1 phosphate signaling complex protein PhoU [Corynebacterium pyruviciproducens]WOT02498.1 phosphate signaling complex protein PhoU [Corynebacterium pyruviciproducens]